MSQALQGFESAGVESPSAPNRPLRLKQQTSPGSDEMILDIHTQKNEEFYTEVFSWGADNRGQLGLGLVGEEIDA